MVCPCYEPSMAGAFRTLYFVKTLGHNKVPMFFWGPITGPGVIRIKNGYFVTRYGVSLHYATVDFTFFLIDLEPDGCLVADQLRLRTQNY